MQQPSEFAQKLKAAMAKPITPHPAIVEARKREGAQHILPLRTKQEEAEIQGEIEPAGAVWNQVVRLHRAHEAYARETARVILSHVESKFQADSLQNFKLALKNALTFILDTKLLETQLGVYQVEHNHIELAIDLIQVVGLKRYMGLAGVQE